MPDEVFLSEVPALLQVNLATTNADERDFFEKFSWPGLLLAAHAELWPR